MCAGVILVFTLTGANIWIAALYSLLIGNLISGFIHAGRYLVWRSMTAAHPPDSPSLAAGWIGWPRMAGVLVVAVACGYLLGAMLADAVTGLKPYCPGGAVAGLADHLPLSIIASVIGTLRSFTPVALRPGRGARRLCRARQVAETQLKLLESQLEPHMLFNTLANLRALIGVDPARAQTMLDRLIDFLRATLNASRRSVHPLADEFSRLQDYLALMQIRMGERLQVELDLPPELAHCEVPALLLQPLVENAIKHGLEPQRGGGRLRLSARRDGEQLLLRVCDTGAGLEGARRNDLPGTGFGLTQVRERLQTLYGDLAGLTLRADEAGGTLAEVHLPCPLTASSRTTP